MRDPGEPGLAGVTIYVDLNNNGQLDRGEPATRSQDDDPNTTDVNETGTYALTDLNPGTLTVREVVPAGYQQTFPPELVFLELPPPDGRPLPEPLPPDAIWWGVYGRFHQVFLGSGEIATGLDFGNQTREVPPRDEIPAAADLDHDGHLDADDIDLLGAAIRAADPATSAHDLTGDRWLDETDLEFLVEGLLKTRFGDANLDGLFDSSDLIKVFQAGEYEDQQTGNSGWQEGDWDGDGDFTSSDLVFAFQHGGYEPR